jgi:serine/threonine protein kinase
MLAVDVNLVERSGSAAMSCIRCARKALKRCKDCDTLYCDAFCFKQDLAKHGPLVCGKADPPWVVGPNFWNELCEKKNRYQIFDRKSFDRVFTWISSLGSGKFGVVKKIQEKKSGKYFALKLLTNMDQDFERELDVHCKISGYNPNALQYYGAFKIMYGNKLMQALLMEYIDGIELEGILRHPNSPFWDSLSEKTVAIRVHIALTVLNGLLNDLVPLHRHRIAHRDIKPGNVLVTFASDKPKIYATLQDAVLIDYGFACRVGPVPEDDGLSCNYWGGSLLFAAPEILDLRVAAVDVPPPDLDFCAADIWAVGSTVWEILIGESPFTKRMKILGRPQTLYGLVQTVSEVIDSLRADKTFLPGYRRLREILIAMMQIDPRKRITAAELHAAYPDLRALPLL